MAEANYLQEGRRVDFTPASALTAGDVVQIPDGRAGVATSAIAAGELGSVVVEGVVEVEKTADVALLQGGEVRWDASANKAHLPIFVDAGDFLLGTVVEDAAASASTVKVFLNKPSMPLISLTKSAFTNAPVFTSGTPYMRMLGASAVLGFSEDAEAQKQDLLSVQGVDPASNWICEYVIEVSVAADTAGQAYANVGLASGTDSTSFGDIAELIACQLQIQGSAIEFRSDDGTTVVGVTDSTVNFSEGTPFHVYIDGRDESDCQIYVNGVNVLPSTVFDLSDASGPLKAIAYNRKSSNDTPGEIQVHKLEVRITPDM